MSLGYHGELFVKIKMKRTYTKKRGASLCHSLHDVKAFALPLLVEASNAESPTMIYIANIPEQLPITYRYKKCSGCIVYTPHRASPLLCS